MFGLINFEFIEESKRNLFVDFPDDMQASFMLVIVIFSHTFSVTFARLLKLKSEERGKISINNK
jgi:hypothetical protein